VDPGSFRRLIPFPFSSREEASFENRRKYALHAPDQGSVGSAQLLHCISITRCCEITYIAAAKYLWLLLYPGIPLPVSFPSWHPPMTS